MKMYLEEPNVHGKDICLLGLEIIIFLTNAERHFLYELGFFSLLVR